MKKDLNILNQGCVFRADQKAKMAALDSNKLRHSAFFSATKTSGNWRGIYWFHHGYLYVSPPVPLSAEKWLPHDNLISFWYTCAMMIIHTCIVHDRRKTPIHFGVKVKFVLWSLHHLPSSFDIKWWYFKHVLTMTQRRISIDSGSKFQRSRSNSDFELCLISAHLLVTLLSFDAWWWYFTHVLPVTRWATYWF